MAEVNLRSWSEISQASEGLQLNSTAATLENILARFARIESRLLEHERRAAATLPPLRPEPDPPDGPLLYAAAQPQFQITCYQLPPPITHQLLQPPQTYQQQQLTCRATQMQPRRQFPQPNSCWYPATQQLHTPPQYPSYTNGPTVYSGYELYKQRIPQPPDPGPPYGVPTYGFPGARPQKQDPIHPVGQPPYTGQQAIGWCPLTSHQCSAAPLPAVAVQPYRGCPLEAVVVPDEAVVVEEVQDKSCSEFMLFNRKSYDGDEMLMVVPPSPAAISLPCSPNVNGEEGELFEDEPPLPAGIPPPCSPNQDYSDHTSVPIELVDSVEFEHLDEGNDRIDVNGENKDRDRVDEKESLVLAEEERCDERERVHSTDSIFETEAKEALVHDVATCLVARMKQLSNDAAIAPTQRPGTFDPGGDTSKHLLYSTLFVASWFPP